MNWKSFLFAQLPNWRRKHPLAAEQIVSLATALLSFLVTWYSTNDQFGIAFQFLLAFTLSAFFYIAPLFFLSYLRQWETQTIPTKQMTLLLQRAERMAVAFGGREARTFFNSIYSHWYRPSKKLALYEQEAKKRFAADYLNYQISTLENHTIQITTDAFTTLYWNLTRLLSSPASKKSTDMPNLDIPKFSRVHVTGMLPEEFFNGPQIVYEDDVRTETSMPRIICHKWEEYDDGFYPRPEQDGTPESRDMDDWREILRVKRYVLVRHVSSTVQAVGALSTKADWEEQKDLVIYKHARRFLDLHNECSGVIARLFRKTGLSKELIEDRKSLLSVINNLLERERYHYFPIAVREPCNAPDRCPVNRKWESLLQAFHAEWHTSPEESLVSVITDDVWTQISRTKRLKHSFLAGHTPEIVLYGNGDETEWYFGLMGHYRPFTRDIRLTFLDAGDAAALAADISRTVTASELGKTKELGAKECHAA